MNKNEYLDEGTKMLTKAEEMGMKYFDTVSQPTMTELVNWFQVEYTNLANQMKASDHASSPDQPNPYHVEGSVWAHTMMVCQEAKNDHKVNMISALLHDIGKPLARDVIPFDAPKPQPNGEERKNTIERGGSEGKMKTHFRGHEGISFWYSIDPLQTLKSYGVITREEMEEILTIVSLHGVLFNRIKDGEEHKPEQMTHIFNTDDGDDKFHRFVKQVRNDSLGRLYASDSGARTEVGANLGVSIYNKDTWLRNRKPESTKGTSTPFIHVLVGLPASGKSTWLKETFQENVTVISKDNEIMKMGEELGICEYTDVYKALTTEQHDETYANVIKTFQEAKKEKKDIVIDMTNMSKKSRNKWINGLGKHYKTKAWVFIASESMLVARNLLRSQQENKYIPEYVYENMMKSFIIPTTYEFDFVEFVHQD